MDAEQHLLDCDSWTPVLVLIQDAETKERPVRAYAEGCKKESACLRHTVPEGYTFGWNKGGTNLHFGGLDGYSSLNSMDSLNRPPNHRVSFLPGIPHSHFIKFVDLSSLVVGLA